MGRAREQGLRLLRAGALDDCDRDGVSGLVAEGNAEAESQ
jgi:hypothetical protein